MAYVRKYWVIDEIVKPADANRWEEAFTELFGSATGSVSGDTIIITSTTPPTDPNDYYVDFIAPEDFDSSKSFIIDNVTFPPGSIKDIQQKALISGAWKAGAPIRLRILNGQLFLTGGSAGSSPIHIGNLAPTEPTLMLWLDTTTNVLKYRESAGSVTWITVKGVYTN